MALIYDNRPYKTRIKECLADDFKVAAIKKAQDVFYDKRNTVVADVPEWLDFRAEAAKLRDHVLNNLDYYVNQFVENAEKAGSKVTLHLTIKKQLKSLWISFVNAKPK